MKKKQPVICVEQQMIIFYGQSYYKQSTYKFHFSTINQEIDKDKENTKVSDEKNQLFMKFLTKVDERDVDERAQPGGDVRYYLNDLKYKTR